MRDVCISVPTVVGCGGARQHIELELTSKERLGLVQSARVLRETIAQVESRIGGVPAKPAATGGNGANVLSKTGNRAIPRSAWQAAVGPSDLSFRAILPRKRAINLKRKN